MEHPCGSDKWCGIWGVIDRKNYNLKRINKGHWVQFLDSLISEALKKKQMRCPCTRLGSAFIFFNVCTTQISAWCFMFFFCINLLQLQKMALLICTPAWVWFSCTTISYTDIHSTSRSTNQDGSFERNHLIVSAHFPTHSEFWHPTYPKAAWGLLVSSILHPEQCAPNEHGTIRCLKRFFMVF